MPLLAAPLVNKWRETAYAYDAEYEPLEQVLQRFADGFGFRLALSGEYGRVNGYYRSHQASQVLDRLALEQRFDWFFYKNTLFISPGGEYVSARLLVQEDAAELRLALTEIGLLDVRFGWGVLDSGKSVLVSGPQAYIELIQSFADEQLHTEENEPQEPVLISLPLRYINADDRSVQYRAEKVLIPGAATLLRRLLDDTSFEELSLQNMNRGDNMSDALIMAKAGASKSSRSAAIRPKTYFRVEPDIRNNAVLVHDQASRRPMYEALIAQIDQPSRLIEIDALILDIDRRDLSGLAVDWRTNNGQELGGVSLLPSGATSTFFIGNRKRFMAQLHALEEFGRASLIASPSVLTLENHPAIIDFSRTEYLSNVGERVASLEAVTVGTSLQVTPRIIEGGRRKQMQLLIDIEDGQFEPRAQGPVLSSTHKSVVSTQVLIEESRALVIGGLQQQQNLESARRIPWLGRIPVLGPLLFSDREHSQSRRERLFILVPRLIGDQHDLRRYVDSGERPLEREVVESVQELLAPRGRVQFIELKGE
ncbi:type III secretion system outer membrane ring subunit SctC [Pseudomonas yamanorum]|uniref:type III secretion system outer membrane ring subunit SctC n=1 Tax=Pseudomonas yamanorum TaxID=515393 RepID=UPI0012FDA8FC|nr:type III secretion system outer membrane ring subunit SctC [Pseudomonas yamanorum]